MKKSLFILATAAIALASCNNDVKIAENKTMGNDPQEIAVFPLSQKVKRVATTGGAIESTTFTNNLDMQVAAYAFPPASTTWDAGVYFEKTTFTGTGDRWVASPSKYWPLTDAYISFLAVAGVEDGDVTMTSASGATVNYDGDSWDAQTDLMYSAAQEHVVQTGNALTYPDDVDMSFSHALALLKFNARVPNGASYNTQLHVDKIEIVDGIKTGTLTLGYSNYNAVGTPTVSHTWTTFGTATNIEVPGSNAYSATAYAADDTKKIANDGSYSECGAALVVPKNAASFTKFTIYYTLDDKPYTFDYTPASTVLNQATKYIYNITFTLTEIIIDPEIVEWTDGGTTLIDIPSFAYAADGTQVVNVPNKAGTYVFTVSNVPAATYTVSEDTSTGDDIVTGQSITAPAGGTLAADGTLTISVTVTENASGTKTRGIKLNNGSSDVMTFTITQTAS